MRTHATFSNCPFGTFYLLFRGKASKWVLSSGGNWLIPFHMGVLTKDGHYINFYRNLPHSLNKFGAWWFLGSFQGISRTRWRDKIGKRGKIYILPVYLAWITLSIGYLILFFPWIIAWAMFGPYWSISWATKGFTKRFK